MEVCSKYIHVSSSDLWKRVEIFWGDKIQQKPLVKLSIFKTFQKRIFKMS